LRPTSKLGVTVATVPVCDQMPARDSAMRQVKRLFGAVLAASLFLVGCGTTKPLPDDGFVQVPGGRVAFRVIGNGRGVPVLLIHGGPGGTSCGYANTLNAVAASRPVVMYDQLGSGNSDVLTDLPRDAVLSRFVAEVAAVRARLGLAEVHLVGHSWGAAVALEYLLTEKPVGVRSVVFVGPLLSTPVWLEDTNYLVRLLPAEAQEAIRNAVEKGKFDTPEFKAADKAFAQHFGIRTPITRDEARKRYPVCASTPQRFNKDLYEYMWGPAEFVSTGTLQNYDRIDRLRELNLPSLFLVGEYDTARPDSMVRFQALVPRSLVKVVPGAGHGVMFDQTEAFNNALADFLAAAERR
jgi:proline iminopeptidase